MRKNGKKNLKILTDGLDALILLARKMLRQHDIKKVKNISEKDVIEKYWRTFFQVLLLDTFGVLAPGINRKSGENGLFKKFQDFINEAKKSHKELNDSIIDLKTNYQSPILHLAAHFFNANDDRISTFIVNPTEKEKINNDNIERIEKLWLNKWEVMNAINNLAKVDEKTQTKNKKSEEVENEEKIPLPFSNSGNFITRYSEENADDSKNLVFYVGEVEDYNKGELVDDKKEIFHVPKKFVNELYDNIKDFIEKNEYNDTKKLPGRIFDFCEYYNEDTCKGTVLGKAFWEKWDPYLKELESFFGEKYKIDSKKPIGIKQLRFILTNHLYFTRTFSSIKENFEYDHTRYYYYLPIWHKSISYLGLVVTKKLKSDEINCLKNFTDRLFGLAYAHDSARKLEQDKNTIIKKSLITAMASIMARNMSHNLGSHVLSQTSYESVSVSDDRKLNSYIQHRMDYIAQISTGFPKWTASAWFLSDLMKRFYMQHHLLNFIGKSEGLSAFYWGTTVQKGIRITITRNGTELIDANGNSPNSLQDFMVDMPGGIVGYQAFYTILENIIRNAAKHDWSKVKEGNLEITINVEEPEEEDCYYLTIFQKIDQKVGNKKEEIHVHFPGSNDQECKGINLQYFCDIMCDSFLDGKGELNKKNWGLAEIRISAGFLNKKDYLEIGSVNKERLIDNDKKNGYIQPVLKDGKLGYRMKMLKPKYVLIVGLNSYKKYKNNIGTNKNLGNFLTKNGVYFLKRITQKDLEEGLNFSFVYFDKDSSESLELILSEGKNHLEKLPCRIMSESEVVTCHGMRIMEIGKLDLEKCFSLKQMEIEDFKIFLYDEYLKKRFGESCSYKLFINVSGEPTTPNGNRIRDFVARDMDGFLKSVFWEMDLLDSVISDIKISIKNARRYSNHINNHILDYFMGRECKADEGGHYIKCRNKIDDIIRKFNIDKDKLISKSKKIYEIYKSIADELLFQYDEKISTLPKTLQTKGHDEKNRSAGSKDANDVVKETKFFEKIIFQGSEKDARELNNLIMYNRHEKKENINQLGEGPKRKRLKYLESLSGAQLYYSALAENYRSNDYNGCILRRELFENGLLRYLIIDERLASYVIKNNNIIRMDTLGIAVFYALAYEEGKLILVEGKGEGDSVNLDDIKDEYDIVIVHQGILDKLNQGILDIKKSYLFFQKVLEKIPWIFVTSGRGKPDQVEEGVKFVPFSIIESTLMKDYPEKYILSMTLMKLIAE